MPTPESELQFESLYKEHAPRMYGFFYAYTSGDHDLAKDLVQDTFYSALKKWQRFNSNKGSIETWLWTIARRHLIDACRKRKRLGYPPPFEEIEKALFQAIDSRPLPDEILERKEARLRIGGVLASLPNGYREVLKRKYLDHQSMREIAIGLDKSEKAVESMLTRARESFRCAFGLLSDQRE